MRVKRTLWGKAQGRSGRTLASEQTYAMDSRELDWNIGDVLSRVDDRGDLLTARVVVEMIDGSSAVWERTQTPAELGLRSMADQLQELLDGGDEDEIRAWYEELRPHFEEPVETDESET